MSEPNKSKSVTFSKTLLIATEFGFIIVLPLVAFSSLGNWLTNKYDNKLFLAGSLILALLASSIWLYRRIQNIFHELTK